MRKHEYIMSSERCLTRSDEMENHVYTDTELKVGDYVTMDGIRWFVVEVVR